jgi:drug/metabolite transporter (DMT)-like permease
MTPRRTHLAKTSVLVALLVFFGSAGNLLFSAGMKQIGAVPGWSLVSLDTAFVQVFTSVRIWLGIASMLLFLAALLLVLSWADFSYVLPATASMYIFIPLLGHFLLGEAVTSLRWLGIGLICLGVVLVGRTPANTTEKD